MKKQQVNMDFGMVLIFVVKDNSKNLKKKDIILFLISV